MMFCKKKISITDEIKKKLTLVRVCMLISLLFIFYIIIFSSHVSAEGNTVCCSETISGAFCQNVPSDECKKESQQVPTNCDSTSYCKGGTCYDSNEGTCMDNTPQLVCNNEGGIWSDEKPLACELGCCYLGDQVAYVSLVRCKRLSSYLGLETDYDKSIQSEAICIATAGSEDKGACVFEEEFENNCKFTTKSECERFSSSGKNGTSVIGTFYKDKLCSAEELQTICGPSKQTTCLEGNDEVYFLDTCGNPANIYDATKVNNDDYWTNVKSKAEGCGAGSSNSGSKSCGNCNYLQGSYCRSDKVAGGNPTYGDFMCADLNCKSTSNGQNYRHGESWCVYDDYGNFDEGDNSVGSKFFKHICINGEEVLEQCGDFRSETCIEDDINGFSQAGCRVNRWQDCTSQFERDDCENTDQRDCLWKQGVFLGNENKNGERPEGSCLPKNPPGFNFWDNEQTLEICSQGSSSCVVKFTKGFFGGEECQENCHCLSESWEKQRIDICNSIGDCGPGPNWIGEQGYRENFKLKIGRLDKIGEDLKSSE